jgi:uncharacterized protein related to proFAR isomerase
MLQNTHHDGESSTSLGNDLVPLVGQIGNANWRRAFRCGRRHLEDMQLCLIFSTGIYQTPELAKVNSHVVKNTITLKDKNTVDMEKCVKSLNQRNEKNAGQDRLHEKRECVRNVLME